MHFARVTIICICIIMLKSKPQYNILIEFTSQYENNKIMRINIGITMGLRDKYAEYYFK